MLDYMTAKEAVKNGFTHHGKYFGIPIWVAPEKDFMVATKWAPMEYVMTAAHHVEGFMRSALFPNDEPAFQLLIGAPIGADTIFQLGQIGKDKATGFEGIIIGIRQYIIGCDQYGLVPPETEYKIESALWFDEGRITIVGDGVTAAEDNAEFTVKG